LPDGLGHHRRSCREQPRQFHRALGPVDKRVIERIQREIPGSVIIGQFPERHPAGADDDVFQTGLAHQPVEARLLLGVERLTHHQEADVGHLSVHEPKSLHDARHVVLEEARHEEDHARTLEAERAAYARAIPGRGR